MRPYTYLIKFKPTGQCYYGSRYKNVRLGLNPEDDLMIKYSTSSKDINDLIEQHGLEAFEWEVRRTFDTPEQATDWEKRVLKRCKVLENEKWFNGNIAGYILPTEKSRKKISEYHRGKAKSEEHKKNLSESQKGKPERQCVEMQATIDLLKATVETLHKRLKPVMADAPMRTVTAAQGLLMALPSDIPAPEFDVDNDGDVILDWAGPDSRMFTIAISECGRIHYAARLSATKNRNGSDIFVDAIPREISDLVRAVTRR